MLMPLQEENGLWIEQWMKLFETPMPEDESMEAS
jgi:hypothetical protein